jgi:integrase
MSNRRSRLAGTIRARGNGFQLLVRYKGKQYSRTVHARTKKDAAAQLPDFVHEVTSGAMDAAREAERIRSQAPTLREYVPLFLREHARMDADGEATSRAYRHSLGYVVARLGDRRISELTEATLRACLRDLHTSGRMVPRPDGSRGLGVETIRLIRATLSVCLSHAVKDGIIPTNPTPKFKELNLGNAPLDRARRSALSQGQVAALLNACGEDCALKVSTAVMSATGARPGEVLALTWGNIDLQARTMRIEHSVKRDANSPGRGRLGSTKTPSSMRTLSIGNGLAAILEQERARQENVLRELAGLSANVSPVRPLIEPDMCIFPAGYETPEAMRAPFSQGAMRARFKAAIHRAGLDPRVSPHWCRHSAITAMLAGSATKPGISVVDAAAIAGHTNASTTARVYAHAVQANLKRGADLADDLLVPTPAANVEQIGTRAPLK